MRFLVKATPLKVYLCSFLESKFNILNSSGSLKKYFNQLFLNTHNFFRWTHRIKRNSFLKSPENVDVHRGPYCIICIVIDITHRIIQRIKNLRNSDYSCCCICSCKNIPKCPIKISFVVLILLGVCWRQIACCIGWFKKFTFSLFLPTSNIK